MSLTSQALNWNPAYLPNTGQYSYVLCSIEPTTPQHAGMRAAGGFTTHRNELMQRRLSEAGRGVARTRYPRSLMTCPSRTRYARRHSQRMVCVWPQGIASTRLARASPETSRPRVDRPRAAPPFGRRWRAAAGRRLARYARGPLQRGIARCTAAGMDGHQRKRRPVRCLIPLSQANLPHDVSNS